MADNALDVHLAEYQSLRQELIARLQAIATLTSSLYTAWFALVTAISLLLSGTLSEKIHIGDVKDVLVCVPLLTLPISMIWLEHIFQIHRIGSYLHFTLRPAVNAFISSKPGTPANGVMEWGFSQPIIPPRFTGLFGVLHIWFGGPFAFMLLMPVCTAYVAFMEGWMRWRHPVILTIDALVSVQLLLWLVILVRHTGNVELLRWLADRWPFRKTRRNDSVAESRDR